MWCSAPAILRVTKFVGDAVENDVGAEVVSVVFERGDDSWVAEVYDDDAVRAVEGDDAALGGLVEPPAHLILLEIRHPREVLQREQAGVEE